MKYKVSNVCQLIKPFSKVTFTANGVTAVYDGSTIHLSGTLTKTGTTIMKNYLYTGLGGHKYLYYYKHQTGQGCYLEFKYVSADYAGHLFTGIEGIYTLPTDQATYILSICPIVIGEKDRTIDATWIPQIFDLTEMYGAGNEPTTIEAFRKDFPDEYYDYSPKCFETIHKLHYVNESGKYLTLNRGKFVTETKNLFDIGNAVPFTFSDENPNLKDLYIDRDIFYNGLSMYNLGAGLRMKNGWTLPAGTYTLSCHVINKTGNIDSIAFGFYWKNINGAYQYGFVWKGPYEDLITSITLGENTEVRLIIEATGGSSSEAVSIKVDDIQVVSGSTATDYQPYKHIAFN